MAISLELEEWVGSAWHRFITRRASPDFPQASIDLAPRQRAHGPEQQGHGRRRQPRGGGGQ